MRVIAGTARGIRLAAVTKGVRPTSDRVRESVFNSLGQFFRGGSVLDLYAGTGALGIEALSRGSEWAVFVEKDRRTAKVIRENLEKTGFVDLAEVVVGDAKEVVGRMVGGGEGIASGKQFNLIFADPPYRIAASEVGEVLPSLRSLLAFGGRIVVEGDAPFDEFDNVVGLEGAARRFGGTFVTVFEKAEK